MKQLMRHISQRTHVWADATSIYINYEQEGATLIKIDKINEAEKEKTLKKLELCKNFFIMDDYLLKYRIVGYDKSSNGKIKWTLQDTSSNTTYTYTDNEFHMMIMETYDRTYINKVIGAIRYDRVL